MINGSLCIVLYVLSKTFVECIRAISLLWSYDTGQLSVILIKLSFQTSGSGETVQIQNRLLLEDQSDHYCTLDLIVIIMVSCT